MVASNAAQGSGTPGQTSRASEPQQAEAWDHDAYLDAVYEPENDLSSTDKAVLALLAHHGRRWGVAWPSRETLAGKMDFDVRTIGRVLKRLEKRGWFRLVGRHPDQHPRSRSNTYKLTIPRLRPLRAATMTEVQPRDSGVLEVHAAPEVHAEESEVRAEEHVLDTVAAPDAHAEGSKLDTPTAHERHAEERALDTMPEVDAEAASESSSMLNVNASSLEQAKCDDAELVAGCWPVIQECYARCRFEKYGVCTMESLSFEARRAIVLCVVGLAVKAELPLVKAAEEAIQIWFTRSGRPAADGRPASTYLKDKAHPLERLADAEDLAFVVRVFRSQRRKNQTALPAAVAAAPARAGPSEAIAEIKNINWGGTFRKRPSS